jgi:hypothetical protein
VPSRERGTREAVSARRVRVETGVLLDETAIARGDTAEIVGGRRGGYVRRPLEKLASQGAQGARKRVIVRIRSMGHSWSGQAAWPVAASSSIRNKAVA